MFLVFFSFSSFISPLYHACGRFYIQEYGDAHVGSINQVGLSQECLLFREDLVAFNRVLWRFAREKPGVVFCFIRMAVLLCSL